MKKLCLLLLFVFFCFIYTVSAEIDRSEYYYIIQENGNTIVGIALYGTGEVDIPIQNDIEDIYVDGGLYILENNTLTVSIGSTQSAVIIYKTGFLTTKDNNSWSFRNEMENQTNKSIMVAIPKKAKITMINPSGLSQTGEFTKIYFDNINLVNINYYFPTNVDNQPTEPDNNDNNNHRKVIKNPINSETQIKNITLNTKIEEKLIEINDNEKDIVIVQNQSNNSNNTKNYYYLLLILPVLIITLTVLLMTKQNKRLSPRQIQLMQTLTKNESSIIKVIFEKKGFVNRSFIEKNLKIAKSSLAATINNLERKKIISVDRTYNSHKVRLEEWFLKL